MGSTGPQGNHQIPSLGEISTKYLASFNLHVYGLVNEYIDQHQSSMDGTILGCEKQRIAITVTSYKQSHKFDFNPAKFTAYLQSSGFSSSSNTYKQ